MYLEYKGEMNDMIGIITIIDNNNYGNRLQNYALYKYISKYDTTETLKNDDFSNTKSLFLLRTIKHLFSKKISINENRQKNFQLFNSNIKFSRKKINAFSNSEKYNYYIVGSDQVWNPNFGRLRDVDLLAFVSPQKRVSYAASIGVDTIPDSKSKQMAKELKKFKSISVREENAKNIIQELTDRKDIDVLIDPTMLLDEDDWLKVVKRPKNMKTKKYILLYFLGEISAKRKKEIERIAKDNNCEIIDILDKNSIYYEYGPSEFLYLEQNAFLVCTDSFHACVFAFLFDRPFVVFDREQQMVNSMNSRIDTFISKFKLINRRFNGKDITKDNLKHNYTEGYRILEKERQKSKKYLEQALDIKDSD